MLHPRGGDRQRHTAVHQREARAHLGPHQDFAQGERLAEDLRMRSLSLSLFFCVSARALPPFVSLFSRIEDLRVRPLRYLPSVSLSIASSHSIVLRDWTPWRRFPEGTGILSISLSRRKPQGLLRDKVRGAYVTDDIIGPKFSPNALTRGVKQDLG